MADIHSKESTSLDGMEKNNLWNNLLTCSVTKNDCGERQLVLHNIQCKAQTSTKIFSK